LLNALNHPFDVVEVNPSSKKEIKDLDSSLKSVPVLQSGDRIIGDSNDIYTYLLEQHATSSPPKHSEKWVRWADDKLAVLLFPNISRTFSDAFRAFEYVHRVPTFDLKTKISNRVIGAFAMWAFARRKVKKKYGIEDERKALGEALETWGMEIQGKTYAGGEVPHTGDIAVFGCLRAIERMPVFGEVIEMNTDVQNWYESMKTQATSD
jgi:microsomal prostaglandin-E synthase 2